MALTVSIQRGSFTIVEADGTTKDVTISSVTQADCIVMFTHRGANSGAYRALRHSFTAVLTSATNLRFQRISSATTTADVVIDWTVVELDASAFDSIQTGEVASDTDPEDVTVSAVTQANSFAIMSVRTARSGDILEMYPRIALTSTTNLRLDYGAAAPTTNASVVRWTLVELEIASYTSLQTGSISIANGSESNTATITEVDTAKSVVLHQGSIGDPVVQTHGRYGTRLRLTDTTTVTADRDLVGTEPNLVVGFAVWEFTDETVTSGTSAFTTSATSANPTFTEVGDDYLIATANTQQNARGSGNSADLASEAGWYCTHVMGSPPDDLTITRSSAESYAIDVAWSVIDFTAAAAGSILPFVARDMMNIADIKDMRG